MTGCAQIVRLQTLSAPCEWALPQVTPSFPNVKPDLVFPSSDAAVTITLLAVRGASEATP